METTMGRSPRHRWRASTPLALAVLATLVRFSWPLLNSETFRRRPPLSITSRMEAEGVGSKTNDELLGYGAPVMTPMIEGGEGIELGLDSVLSLEFLPRIIVFDLDNTIWTPELYQLRQRHVPQVDKDVRLFPDAARILEWWCRLQQQLQPKPNPPSHDDRGSRAREIRLAIASRTSKSHWANHLLDDFRVSGRTLRSCFAFVEIQTGTKKEHMSRIRQASGVPYHEMLFVDDDARLNLVEVSSQLGVLCCHTPRGVTVEHFVKALHRYSELKAEAAANGTDPWMGYVLNSRSLNIAEPTVPEGTVRIGRVKFYSGAKRFGFLVDEGTGQELFVHESKVPSGMRLQVGDKVRFKATVDSSGRAAAVVLAPTPSSFADRMKRAAGARAVSVSTAPTKVAAKSDRVPFASVSTSGDLHINSKIVDVTSPPASIGATNADFVYMSCFSMGQPFTALLLNGYKTVESRNNPMFMEWKPGTRMLLHCGQRDWPDTESYKSRLPTSPPPSSAAPIDRAAQLRTGFSKGSVIGVVTIGRTCRSSAAERDSSDLQRRVLAPADGIGTYCTEIVRASWLKRPVAMRGRSGVYNVVVPLDCLPQ